MTNILLNRELTYAEKHLVRWMLEHGSPEARQFLPQLEQAQVTPWRCLCGCASIQLSINGQAEPPGGMHAIADFGFGDGDDVGGIFVYEISGVLAGIEVWSIASDAPKILPMPGMLSSLINEPGET